jgi:Fe-coproporphyrin III synthase
MNTLVSIVGADDSPAWAAHEIHALPVLVIFPHNQCNCRCVMCDIWRIREAKRMSPEDLERQLSPFRQLGVRWVVLSGGEPQLNEKWCILAQMLRSIGCRVTLLTAGLLLKPQAEMVTEYIDDVIVSLDGPATVHNSIRRIPDAFEQMVEGIRALRQFRPAMPVGARCTVQRSNRRSLRSVIECAKLIGLTSISFLAADLTSTAFNRPEPWPCDRAERVGLTPQEVDELGAEIERLVSEHRPDFNSGFILETPDKLRRIVHHFRGHLGQTENVAPRCNAPWVSAVIEASGEVRPCFFHPALGNIREQSFSQIVNGANALRFRSTLNVAHNQTCKRCVCSLYLERHDHFGEK